MSAAKRACPVVQAVLAAPTGIASMQSASTRATAASNPVSPFKLSASSASAVRVDATVVVIGQPQRDAYADRGDPENRHVARDHNHQRNRQDAPPVFGPLSALRNRRTALIAMNTAPLTGPKAKASDADPPAAASTATDSTRPNGWYSVSTMT